MQIQLQWHDGQRVRQFSQAAPITIGREADNHLVMTGDAISRYHARIVVMNGQAYIVDNNSSNGTRCNGQPCQPQLPLKSGDVIEIGRFQISVQLIPLQPIHKPMPKTLRQATPPVAASRSSGYNVPAPLRASHVSVAALRSSGFDVAETTYLAIGGGIGSFTWIDHLLIYGANAADIMCIGLEKKPYSRYERLCAFSQIPRHERLRSNSDSCPDNIWGWPGYAVREIASLVMQMRFGAAAKVLWQIFAEPTFAQTYTPRAGNVFKSMDREAQRIGWDRLSHYGRVRTIRKTDDGRYVVAYTETRQDTGRVTKYVVARYVHLAIGYPSLRVLPDLRQYREQTRDYKRVVNAYDDHEHVYTRLRQHGGTVLLRGRGIVASRILQRIYELRAENSAIRVVHLMRTPKTEGYRFGAAKRTVANHWEFQPFNWPKACWGGDLRVQLEDANEDERQSLLKAWEGTTTADRTDWRDIVEEGRRSGWYKIDFGNVHDIQPQGQQIALQIKARDGGGMSGLSADFIIDCTGLVAEISVDPLLNDMITHYSLQLNKRKRLHVSNDFMVTGMENGEGKMFASGTLTLGGPYAPVDSFLGLQYAAQRSVDTLTSHNAPGLRYLNGLRSVRQWLRWVQGVTP